jgi:hypothetical protein
MPRKYAGPIAGLITLLFLVGCGSPIIPAKSKPLVNVYNGCNAYCTKVGVVGLAREINKKLLENEYIVVEPKNLLNYKVVTEIVYARRIPIHFLEANAEGGRVVLHGVANTQAAIDSALAAAREVLQS